MAASRFPIAGCPVTASAVAATLAVGAASLLWRLASSAGCAPIDAQPKIKELWVYPVKGCRGVRVSQLTMTARGVRYDREWIVLFRDSHEPATLRNVSKLALVHTAIDEERGQLVLSAEGHGSVAVPLVASASADRTSFSVWGLPGEVVEEDRDTVGCWLQSVTGASTPLGLYHVVAPRQSTMTAGKNRELLAQDSQHVLLLSDGSIEAIAKACGDPSVDAHRFRPNIVVSAKAWEELRYRVLDLPGGTRLWFTKWCTRCSVPTVRENGTKHPQAEPTKTLRAQFSARPLHNPREGRADPITGSYLSVCCVGAEPAVGVEGTIAVLEIGGAPPFRKADAN